MGWALAAELQETTPAVTGGPALPTDTPQPRGAFPAVLGAVGRRSHQEEAGELSTLTLQPFFQVSTQTLGPLALSPPLLIPAASTPSEHTLCPSTGWEGWVQQESHSLEQGTHQEEGQSHSSWHGSGIPRKTSQRR